MTGATFSPILISAKRENPGSRKKMGGRGKTREHQDDRWAWVTRLNATQLAGYQALAERRIFEETKTGKRDDAARNLQMHLDKEQKRRNGTT